MASRESRTAVQQLARDAGLSETELPVKLQRLSGLEPESFKSLIDEQRAEQILQEKISSGVERKPSLLTRSISKRRVSSYTFKNATAALSKVIEEESAGVVQALLEIGGDANAVKNKETKCAQTEERARLLITAVRAGKTDTVSLLAPRSPKSFQNEALVESLALGHRAIASRLLQYDADPNYCKREFELAVSTADWSLVSLLLQAPTQIQNNTLINALTAAVRSESLRTVKLLVEAANFGNEKSLPAVEEAVSGGQVEILLAMLSHTQSLSTEFLDDLILKAFQSNRMTVDTKQKIFEALFCAGAHGEKSAAAFVLVIEQQPCFIDVFANHHANINWAKAQAVRRAIKNGDSDLVRRVLRSGGLRASSAAEALKAIPRSIPAEHRVSIIHMLLEFNPRGAAVDEQLVFAVQDRLEDAIIMLRNYGASLDNNEGGALIEAIKFEQVATIRHLLSRAVDPDVLRKAFPHLRRAGKLARRLMTGLLLNARASGPEVDAALRDAVCDRDQDPELIDLLINGKADPTFHESQSLRHAIATEDIALLRKLLRCPAEVSSSAVSALLSDVMRSKVSDIRHRMLQELIEVDANQESLSRALCLELSDHRCDDDIVLLLFSRGNADPNFENGRPLCSAALQPSDKALRLLASSARTTRVSRRNAAVALFQSKLAEGAKAARASTLIDIRDCETVVLGGLKAHLEACQSAYPQGRQWPLECFRVLLATKPNLELDGGEVMKTVIYAAAIPLLTLLLKSELSQPAIKIALMQSLSITDSNDRFEVCRAILRTRPSRDTLSDVLVSASEQAYHPICEMLLEHGAKIDHNDHAAIRYATSQPDLYLLGIIIKYKPLLPSLQAAFGEARSLPIADDRLAAFQMILNAGPECLRGELLDQYLINIVESEDCDPRLVQLLLDKEASVEAYSSQSVIFVATNCKFDLLHQLWAHVTLPETSRRCFEACLGGGLVQGYKVDILRFLLQQGARGPSLDHALFAAVDCLANTLIPLEMVRLLLSFGADPNFQEGLTLCRACEIGRIEAVDALITSNSFVRSRAKALHYVLRSDPHLTPSQDFCQIVDLLVAPRPWDPGFPQSNETPTYSGRQGSFDPAARTLLERRPEGARELEKVLESGYKFSSRHESDLLAWSMDRTTPKIHPQCIELLMEHGANTRFIDGETGESLVMTAIRTRKSRLLNSLIRHHADVSQKDKQGRSPLLLAVQMDDLNAVAELLTAGPTTDDGSLHQAVRRLNPNIVKLLLDNGHDPTLPSSYHGRRTPLAELVCKVTATATNLDKIREVILLLQRKGADVTKHIAEKPLICLALDSSPYMAEALLRAYLHKLINEEFNLYWTNSFCYSPTMYVHQKICRGPTDQLMEKWNVLKAYGAEKDVFYAWKGRQPKGAKGVPEELLAAESLAQQREEQKAEEEEEHQIRLRHMKEVSIEAGRAKAMELERDLERTRAVERQEQENLKLRHDLNRALKNEDWADEQNRELERQTLLQHERKEERDHEAARARAVLSQQKQLQSAEQEHHKQIKYQEHAAIEHQAKLQRSLERDRDSYHSNQHERKMKELTMARAMPIGVPYMLQGQTNQRMIEYD